VHRGLHAGTGFTLQLLVDLIRDGLAMAEPETMRAAGQTIAATRIMITEVGRRALNEP
jgi:hypothetical protein